MDADLEPLLISVSCTADDLLPEPPRNAQRRLSDAEVLTLKTTFSMFIPGGLAIVVRDPQTVKRLRLTVIGVLSDTAPFTMAGIWTSQTTLAAAFGSRVVPTVHSFALRPGVDPVRTAAALESAFLANDQAEPPEALDEAVVVERRQQIGVLRAIGFRRRMVQACFLLESSFIALTAIVVGTALGRPVGYSVIIDTRRQPGWSKMPFHVPWLTLGLSVAMVTTLAPARRASHVYPSEALRYQ